MVVNMTVRESVVGQNLLGDDFCEPGTQLVIPAADVTPLAASLKVLGDPTRMRIIQILAANGSVCACDLEEPLGLSQPTVSHHLRQLADAGLVSRQKRGTWAFYQVIPEELAKLMTAVTETVGR